MCHVQLHQHQKVHFKAAPLHLIGVLQRVVLGHGPAHADTPENDLFVRSAHLFHHEANLKMHGSNTHACMCARVCVYTCAR